jgi:pimeloyl-ACP methyl ester carboxylesterase
MSKMISVYRWNLYQKMLIAVFCIASTMVSNAQNIPYGNNPAAGKYLNVGDAQLYYEVYGKGHPIVLLHGGIYGYIDEFSPFIPKLVAENFQVICIATRGHGKSETGKEPFSYKQRAEDAYKVIRAVTQDSVIVLGFSDGAASGLKLAALYPEVVERLISIGMGDRPKNEKRNFNYTADELMKTDSAFFKGRLALMPEPKRWDESLAKSSKMYNDDYMSEETFSLIKSPVLVMGGDRDNYYPVETITKCARAIPKARLSIIPGCSHVVFFCNFPAVWEAIKPFIGIK